MNLYVLDCSIIVPWFFPEESESSALALMRAVGQGRIGGIAPELLQVEFANVAWKKSRRGLCSAEQAAVQVNAFSHLTIEYIAAPSILPTAFSIACLHGLPVYDCLYLAAAKLGDIGIATLDQKLAACATALGIPRWLQ